jgi:hypothetical protein
MNQAVEMTSRLLNLLTHFLIAVHVKHVCDQVKRILIVLDIRVQTSKVEAICEIIFVDLTEVFVAAGGDEL